MRRQRATAISTGYLSSDRWVFVNIHVFVLFDLRTLSFRGSMNSETSSSFVEPLLLRKEVGPAFLDLEIGG